MKFDKFGRELPDSTPVEMPAGLRRSESTAEMVQRMIRGALSRRAAEVGLETFEEAHDFDMEDDDLEPVTEHEFRAMKEEIPAEDREVFEKWRADRAKRKEKAASRAADEEAGESSSEDGGEGGEAGGEAA